MVGRYGLVRIGTHVSAPGIPREDRFAPSPPFSEAKAAGCCKPLSSSTKGARAQRAGYARGREGRSVLGRYGVAW